MSKTILITGATDGIGKATAAKLLAEGHSVLVHGRSTAKLDAVRAELGLAEDQCFLADLSDMGDAASLADAVMAKHSAIDALINNAGVYKTPSPLAPSGHDLRFAVNTLAPYVLMRKLAPALGAGSRVVNVSSAAQAPVSPAELKATGTPLADGPAYAKSKLAITMWSRVLGRTAGPDEPMIVAVNPGSLLGSKMVNEAFGIAGSDIGIGADILYRAAVGPDFADAGGTYWDNDNDRFADPHGDALDDAACRAIVQAMDEVLAPYLG